MQVNSGITCGGGSVAESQHWTGRPPFPCGNCSAAAAAHVLLWFGTDRASYFSSLVAEAPSVRLIVGIAVLIVGVGALSCRWEGPAARSSPAPPSVRWVRTVDGWEQPESWRALAIRPPRLHPLVVATGQVLLSLFALAAFSSGNRPPR